MRIDKLYECSMLIVRCYVALKFVEKIMPNIIVKKLYTDKLKKMVRVSDSLFKTLT